MKTIGRVLVAGVGAALSLAVLLWDPPPAATWPQACVYAAAEDGIVNTTVTAEAGCEADPLSNQCTGGVRVTVTASVQEEDDVQAWTCVR